METVTRNVKDIGTEERRALEHVIGHDLTENQKLVINVVSIESKHPEEDAQVQPEVPAWWNIYDGLTIEEVDRLDQAIRQRANLTRDVE